MNNLILKMFIRDRMKMKKVKHKWGIQIIVILSFIKYMNNINISLIQS